MSKNSNSYRTILKGTALFGGVQVFNIIINLIRGKLVAILLGPDGMGISSLLFASANTIQQFSSLGINLSAVKEISNAKENENTQQISFIIKVIHRLLQITAIIGALFAILFSSQLSIWTFGDESYQWHFIFLSVMIYFTTLSNGELSILQGTHKVKKLAYASIIGSSVGLLIGTPLYYFYHYNGIVPAMIVLSIATYSFYRYNSPTITTHNNLAITWKEASPLIKRMLSLGLAMVLANLLGTIANYLLNTFISHHGTLNDVGLYQAANSITNQYIGLVFTAMSLDFFPRLSAICNNNIKIKELVNQQSEIVVLLVAPIAIILIILAPVVIRILLTDQFLSLVSIIRWMGIGIFFKAIAFPMGYISFAKGDKKTFLWLEGIWGNLLVLSLNTFFYYNWGIEGIGVSFVISYIMMNITYIIITKKLYQFQHNKSFITISITFFLLLVSVWGCSFITNIYFSYISMGILFIITSIFSLYQLNKRLSIFNFKYLKRQ